MQAAADVQMYMVNGKFTPLKAKQSSVKAAASH
jgi:hypothetical protein